MVAKLLTIATCAIWLEDYDSVSSYVPTTTIPSLTTPILLLTTPSSRLAAYHLERCSWAEQFLNSTLDALILNVNGTEINLKLSKDDDVPKTDGGDVACPTATDGAAGSCVYLTRCKAAADITSDNYTTLHCAVNDGYAGICCPASEITAN